MDKNKIKFDHFNNIKELIQHLEMWYAEDDYFAYDRWFHLDDARKMGIYVYEQYKEIERLKEELEYTIPIVEHNKTITKHLKEIERLKNINEEHRILNGKLRVENSRLNNIINELEKWLRNEYSKYNGAIRIASVLDKIQELKGEDKE